MEWLQANRTDVQFDILSLHPGELDVAYAKYAQQVFCVPVPQPKGLKLEIEHRLRKRMGIKKANEKELFFTKLKQQKYDLIYANSIVSVAIACALKQENTKVLAHIHEMKVNIQKYAPNLNSLIPKLDHVIAASKIVKKQLVAHWEFTDNAVSVIYEMSKIKPARPVEKISNTFRVGAVGTVGWRKGIDVFLQLVNYLNLYFPEHNVDFVWVGPISDSQRLEIASELEKMKVQHKVEITGSIENPVSYFKSFDVFVLTSREDPFPLVCIELGMLGKPILCFEGATGTAEVLDTENVFPYLDIRAMAEKVIDLLNQPIAVKRLGEANKEIFSKYSTDNICTQIDDLIFNHVLN
jgi:glycosyltransferase involved in cell wall biosynthesis